MKGLFVSALAVCGLAIVLVGCGGSSSTPAGPAPGGGGGGVTDYGAIVAPVYNATIVQPNGTQDTFLSAINANGDIVGYSTPDSTSNTAAVNPFVLVSGVAKTIPVTGTRVFPTAINDSGVVVGYIQSPLQGWYGNSSTVTILQPPTGQTDIAAYAINNSGLVACSSGNKAYTVNLTTGAYSDLGTLGGSNSRPWAINESGVVVGESQNTSGNKRPVKFVAGGTPVDLMNGSGFVGLTGSAKDVNDSGLSVGYADVTGSNSNAFFANTSGLTNLTGSLNATFSEATSVNNKNLVVGTSSTSANTISYGWTVTQGLIDLTSRIKGLGTFTQLQILSVNDKGVMIGSARITASNKVVGVILTPAAS